MNLKHYLSAIAWINMISISNIFYSQELTDIQNNHIFTQSSDTSNSLVKKVNCIYKLPKNTTIVRDIKTGSLILLKFAPSSDSHTSYWDILTEEQIEKLRLRKPDLANNFALYSPSNLRIRKMILSNNLVLYIVANKGMILLYDAYHKKIKWKLNSVINITDFGYYNSFLYYKDNLYVLNRINSKLYCINVKDGNILWSTSAIKNNIVEKLPSMSTLYVTQIEDKEIIFCTCYDKLIGLDCLTGKQIISLRLPTVSYLSKLHSEDSPIITNIFSNKDVVFIVTNNHIIKYKLSLNNANFFILNPHIVYRVCYDSLHHSISVNDVVI